MSLGWNYQILLKSVNIWKSNHKNKKVNFFETQCIYKLKIYLRSISLPICNFRGAESSNTAGWSNNQTTFRTHVIPTFDDTRYY